MQRAISVFKVLLGNFLFLLILTFVLNFVLGKYLNSTKESRSELPNYKLDKDLGREIFFDYGRIRHEYAPFSGWKTLPYSGETLNIRKDGYRLVPLNSSPISNDKTVGFFGGSTLWGEGSPDEGTIPAVFKALNPNYYVYNFGQLAFNSRQNLAVLTNLYSSGKRFDLVIFYDGVNDAAFLCPEKISVPGHRMEPVFKERLYSGNQYLINKALYKYLVQNIIIFTNRIRINYFGQEMQSEYLCYKNESKIDLIAEGMLNNWQMAEQLVTSHGGTFIGIIQPMAYRGRPKLDHIKTMDPELGISMNMVYDRLLQKIDKNYSITTLNFIDVFDKNEYIYIDFCHVSPNGNEIIAKKLTKFINHKDSIPVD